MEVAAERERQEREAERRLREMQQHLESLLKVVRRTQEASSGSVLWAASSQGDQEVKLTRLPKADDVEAYLSTFERMMAEKHKYTYFDMPQSSTSSMKSA